MDLNLIKAARVDVAAKIESLSELLSAIDRVIGLFDVHAADPPPAATPERETPRGGARAVRKTKASDDRKTRTEKPCHKCHTVKPLSEYPTNHQCADGHTGTCKNCTKARHDAHRAACAPKPETLDSAESDYPKNCDLCHAICQTERRYARHMELVHGKAA
jgi:hypothetical protein